MDDTETQAEAGSEISGPWRFQSQVWSFQLSPNLTQPRILSLPLQLAWGWFSQSQGRFWGFPSRGPAQVLPSQSPHSKPSPSPVSPSLLLPGGFGSPWGAVPIPGSGPASGRGSGCSSQVRNNKSLSTLSQLGSRAGRAWLSSFLQRGLPQLLTVMGIFQPGSLKITLRNNPACRCGSL